MKWYGILLLLLFKCVSTSQLAEQESLISWAISNGAYLGNGIVLDKINTGNKANNINGLITQNALVKNSIVSYTPINEMVIHVSFVYDELITLLSDCLSDEELNILNDHELITLYILFVKYTPLYNKHYSSPHYDYIHALPDVILTPLQWTKIERSLFSNTSLYFEIIDRQQHLLDIWKHIKKITSNSKIEHGINQLTFKQFTWAYSVVSSRIHSVSIPIPSSSGSVSHFQWKEEKLLVPLADLLNYNSIPNTKCATELSNSENVIADRNIYGDNSGGNNDGIAVFVCRTIQSVEQGEELHSSYSKQKLSNSQLVLDYGFIEQNQSTSTSSYRIHLPLNLSDPKDILFSNIGKHCFHNHQLVFNSLLRNGQILELSDLINSEVKDQGIDMSRNLVENDKLSFDIDVQRIKNEPQYHSQTTFPLLNSPIMQVARLYISLQRDKQTVFQRTQTHNEDYSNSIHEIEVGKDDINHEWCDGNMNNISLNNDALIWLFTDILKNQNIMLTSLNENDMKIDSEKMLNTSKNLELLLKYVDMVSKTSNINVQVLEMAKQIIIEEDQFLSLVHSILNSILYES